jgi:hypothetical protein
MLILPTKMKTTVCHVFTPPNSHIGKEKRKKKWVKEIKCTKKKKEHKKDEAQEAVIYSFGKFFCDKKIWNYLFLTCKLD